MSEETAARPAIRVAVVGPCASGKSTLVHRLRSEGWDARMPAQEHSEIPDMWRKMLQPDVLIGLDARDEVLQRRRPDVDLASDYLAMERRRLEHARSNAALLIDTSDLTPEEVHEKVMTFLHALGS